MKHDSNKACILVVDDDIYVLDSITKLLKEYGYSVVACKSGDEAMNVFQKDDINIVLTDIKMPGISGIELLERVHAFDSELPVILMTAYADLDVAIAAIKQGAFDFITKPCKAEHLFHTVQKAVRFIHLLQLEKDYTHKLEDNVMTQTQELSSLSKEIIYRLTSVAEFRDTDIGAHIARMGIYANKIAESLNMPTDFINKISYASPLHDIGKIGIPDNILLKPGRLTGEEFEIMKSHSAIGERILSGSADSVIQLSASIALNHHERWDGTGYPNGLKGEDIPIEGRIVIVCDQYDALRSKRPYKATLSHHEVVKIITEGDGRTMPGHFDPAVLDLFKELTPTFEEIYNANQD